MPFVGSDNVVVEQVDDENWELRHDLVYQGRSDRWTIPAGTGTDFASVPRVVVWFLPRYGRYTRAAILHDYLWREKATAGQISWLDADGVFRRAMRELDVPFLRRWIMWAAVRWMALTKPRGAQGWWKEAWRVLLLTVVALPVVAPPAVLVLVALVAFWIVELVVWVVLRLARPARTKLTRTPPSKQLNAPSLDLSTTS